MAGSGNGVREIGVTINSRNISIFLQDRSSATSLLFSSCPPSPANTLKNDLFGRSFDSQFDYDGLSSTFILNYYFLSP